MAWKEDYEVLYRDLADRVYHLLLKQKEYFRTRDYNVLKDCKQREKEIYDEVNNVVHPSLKRTIAETKKIISERNLFS